MSSPPSADVQRPARPPRRVAVIGSTGSIGLQALAVVEANQDEFRVVALATGSNVRLLAEQARRHSPLAVAAVAARPESIDLPVGIDDESGSEDALLSLATRDDVDIVVVGTTGIVSLRPARSSPPQTRRHSSPAAIS
jgi:1-deoxy-D-xylulose-5-phosphate reductoisomerase